MLLRNKFQYHKDPEQEKIKVVKEVILGCIKALENDLPEKKALKIPQSNYDIGFNDCLFEIQGILNKYKKD